MPTTVKDLASQLMTPPPPLELVTKGRDQRDYYYFTSLGHYKLEEFEEADSCVDRVLQMEPNNLQAKTLKQLITRKIRRGGDLYTCSYCTIWILHHTIIRYNLDAALMATVMRIIWPLHTR